MTVSSEHLSGLVRVYEQAQSGDHSGALVCQRFLLGLYNGHRFPFDMTDFRRLDLGNFEACLQVLELDHMPQREVHDMLAVLLNKPRVFMSLEFEQWGYDQRLKGRCKKEGLEGLKRALQAENARRAAALLGAPS
jgi:hypothetical protein